MGPILAECCQLLHNHLGRYQGSDDTHILFCTRGGLVMHQALQCYLERTNPDSAFSASDLHISRLAAARVALESNPQAAAELLESEFTGRSFAEAASVLAGFTVEEDGIWSQPCNIKTLLKLLNTSSIGEQAYESMCIQGELLRRHVSQISAGSARLVIADTGVHGSIGYYLSLGLKQEIVDSVLLFHANYKNINAQVQPSVTGLVCNDDHYTPWRPRSVTRLYWPFIEAFFEPNVESVRTYSERDDGAIVSNLQQNNWVDTVKPSPGSVRGGAFDYIKTADKQRLIDTDRFALHAWKALRGKIILPTAEDIAIMGLNDKSVDFGFEETYSMNAGVSEMNLFQTYSKAQQSPWPEGELAGQMPQASLPILYLMETGRYLSSLKRRILLKQY